MCTRKLTNKIASTMLALPLILFSTGSLGEDEQVLSDVILGVDVLDVEGLPVSNDIVRAELAAESQPFYTAITDPDANRDIRATVLSGAVIKILDGNFLRRLNANGEEQIDHAYPVDCTRLIFMIPKGKNLVPEFLKTCSTFTSLLDGTDRIVGQTKGKSFVSLAYNPANSGCDVVDLTDPVAVAIRNCVAVRVANGTPPEIVDIVGDESGVEGAELLPVYWALGDKKKILSFLISTDGIDPDDPDDLDSEPFEVKATLNGKNLRGLAPHGLAVSGERQVIVADDDGILYAVDTGTSDVQVWVDRSLPLCLPDGRKTEQKFPMRSDENLLYVGDRACGTVSVYDLKGIFFDTNGTGAPFLLDNVPESMAMPPMPPIGDGVPDANPIVLDVQVGNIGDFGACTGDDVSLACQIGQVEGEAQLFQMQFAGDSETTYRAFKFNFQDCRYVAPASLEVADRCPIPNCADTGWDPSTNMCTDPAVGEQLLDLMALALRAAPPEFEAVLPNPLIPPVITLPGWLSAEDVVPSSVPPHALIPNNRQFFWFFIDTGVIVDGLFQAQYDVDILRDGLSNDICTFPPEHSSIDLALERFNVIGYTPALYNTVNRGDLPSDPEDRMDNKGAFGINTDCNRDLGTGYRWSGQVVGVEITSQAADALLEYTTIQMAELVQAKNELLCTEFLDPGTGIPTGPVWNNDDCDDVQHLLDLLQDKVDVCHASAIKERQGNSGENCGAVFSHIENVRDFAENEATSPDPDVTTPVNLRLLGPNYVGEFLARLAGLEYAANLFLRAIPPDGI